MLCSTTCRVTAAVALCCGHLCSAWGHAALTGCGRLHTCLPSPRIAQQVTPPLCASSIDTTNVRLAMSQTCTGSRWRLLHTERFACRWPLLDCLTTCKRTLLTACTACIACQPPKRCNVCCGSARICLPMLKATSRVACSSAKGLPMFLHAAGSKQPDAP
jgi:hypothetical protein